MTVAPHPVSFRYVNRDGTNAGQDVVCSAEEAWENVGHLTTPDSDGDRSRCGIRITMSDNTIRTVWADRLTP